MTKMAKPIKEIQSLSGKDADKFGNKMFIENYPKEFQKALNNRDRKIFHQGELSGRMKCIEEIDNLKNPYPEDIFPKIELSEFQTHTINDFLCSHLRITLDGFAAELMRRARDNLKEELKQRLGEKDGT